jgi:hypothetical protein
MLNRRRLFTLAPSLPVAAFASVKRDEDEVVFRKVKSCRCGCDVAKVDGSILHCFWCKADRSKS